MTSDNRPNFFLIGAPKAGTTSLFDYIIQHPQVFPSKVKETHFFWDDDRYERGTQWYLDKYFEGAASYPVRGDGTPEYLRSGRVVAPRIQQFAQGYHPKFLVILRDPVDRAWSNYLHRRSYAKEDKSFEEALKLEGERLEENPTTFAAYFDQGRYGAHLQTWFDHFDRSHFCIILLSDLKSAPDRTMRKVFDFLGVDVDCSIETSTKKNRTGRPRSRRLFKAMSSPPRIVSAAFRTLVPLHLQHQIRRAIKRSLIVPYADAKPEIPANVSAELRERYAEDIALLESLTELDLSHWKAH